MTTMKNILDCSKFKYRIFQYLAAIAANLGMLSIGIHYGWPSSSIPILTNGNYTFQMSNSEASWMVAVTPMGSVIGDVFAGLTLNTFGRKRLIMLSSIPLVISWILVGLASSSVFLFIARIIAGIVDGLLFTAIPPFLAEISDPDIRGFLGTTYFVTLVFGMLLSNIFLFFMSIPTCAYISAVISTLMLTILPFLPESPYFHLMKNEMLLAKSSLQKFRGKGDVTEELGRIAKGILEEEKLGKGKISELITNTHNRKCLLLSFALTSIQQLSGIIAIQSYCETVFQETSYILDPEIANIIYFVVYFLSTLIALVLVDISGRRPLIILSTVVVCITLFTNGTYLYLKNQTDVDIKGYESIQIAALLVFTIAYSIGLNNVPILVSSEIFPSNIKGKAFCLINMCFSFVSTCAIKYFSWATDSFGMFVPFYTYGIFTVVGIVLIVIYLPETKQKTLEDIQLEMKSKKHEKVPVSGAI